MATEHDIAKLFKYLRAARVHKPPHIDDGDIRDVYLDALRNIRSDVVAEVGRAWIQDPDGGKFWPTAADLLNLALAIESQERSQVREVSRGCQGCGEVLNEDGTIHEHGSGFRSFIQHCHPLNADGDVDFDAAPYRIGHRLVLCDCTKGRQIAAAQELEMHREIPKGQISGRPANWRPTLTLAKAWRVFHRVDARIYVTGSHARLIPEDRRHASPFFSRPSPEELIADWDEASRQRQAAYDYLRGNVSTTAKAYLATSTVDMKGEL